MHKIAIRPLTAPDLNAVNEVGREAYGAAASPEHLAEAITGRGFSAALVAVTEADEVVGFILWETTGMQNSYIENLVVATQWQDRGIGRQLMESAFAIMIENGSVTASLNVSVSNHRAIALYGQLGFQWMENRVGCMLKSFPLAP